MVSGTFLLNKTMSRNGGTLVCQLLEGHPQIFFPPFHFNVAIDDPKCWPLTGLSQMNVEEFAERILRKCSVWQGSDWFDAINQPLGQDPRFLSKLLNFSVLRKVCGGVVNEDNFEVAMYTLFEDLLAIFGETYQQECLDAQYFFLDADHSFNCGVRDSQNRFRGMTFVQSIRNVYDVVASRKNMLLHHNSLSGDPRDFTLRREVVEAEVTRWIWSVMTAIRHMREAPNQCLTIQFESLHRNRNAVMRQAAAFLDINFESSLLIEGRTQEESSDNKNSRFMSGSSLLRITGGSKSRVVGSAVETLNEQEWAHANNLIGQSDLEWPDIIDVFGFESYLVELGHSQISNWLRNQHISLMVKQRSCRRVMEIYSSMNYGRSEAAHAFESSAPGSG